MPMKGARSKVPLSGHFKWLSQCQDWFTKSGCHSRILKLETWNFAWGLILPIHMLYKKRGSIWELFEKLAQPTMYRVIKKEGVKNIYLYLQNYLNHKNISYIPESLRTGHLCWCVFLAYFYIFVSFINQVSFSDYFPKPSSFKAQQCS